MSLMEDEKNRSEYKRHIQTIAEVDENEPEKKQGGENSLMDSQRSAAFPDVPVKLQLNMRA